MTKLLDQRYLTLSILSKTLSYTKTAQQLFITQPAVSQQVKSLENELRVSLVTNTRGHLRLTSAGQELAKYAHQVQLESTKVLQQIQSAGDQRPVQLGCTLSLSSFLLPELINMLQSTTDHVTARIGNTDKVLQALRDGRIDFGLVEGNFDKQEFSALHIRDEEFIGVVGAHHPLASQAPITQQQLLTNQLIVREAGSGTREIFANWLATQNCRINDFHQIIEIGNPTPIIALLQRGIGVSFMYESLVSDLLASGSLVKLSVAGFTIHHPINLVYLKNSYFGDEYTQIANLLTK